jgi:hypothetical protein
MLVDFRSANNDYDPTRILHIHQVKYFEGDQEYRYAGYVYGSESNEELQFYTTILGVRECDIRLLPKTHSFGPSFQPWGD